MFVKVAPIERILNGSVASGTGWEVHLCFPGCGSKIPYARASIRVLLQSMRVSESVNRYARAARRGY
jgi:hypothetical protein